MGLSSKIGHGLFYEIYFKTYINQNNYKEKNNYVDTEPNNWIYGVDKKQNKE